MTTQTDWLHINLLMTFGTASQFANQTLRFGMHIIFANREHWFLPRISATILHNANQSETNRVIQWVAIFRFFLRQF